MLDKNCGCWPQIWSTCKNLPASNARALARYFCLWSHTPIKWTVVNLISTISMLRLSHYIVIFIEISSVSNICFKFNMVFFQSNKDHGVVIHIDEWSSEQEDCLLHLLMSPYHPADLVGKGSALPSWRRGRETLAMSSSPQVDPGLPAAAHTPDRFSVKSSSARVISTKSVAFVFIVWTLSGVLLTDLETAFVNIRAKIFCPAKMHFLCHFVSVSSWPGVKMSHQRAEKKISSWQVHQGQ